jgi:folate-binding protein YgfZ
MRTADRIALLRAGEAFADLSGWRTVSVSGADAIRWLNDLVTAEVGDLRAGSSRPSLLLAPTGGILAGFTVTVVGDVVLLIQDPIQRRAISSLLEPYVLSADVRLEDRTGSYAIFAFPGRTHPLEPRPGTEWSAPSCLGAGGDLVTLDDHDRVLASLRIEFEEATPDEVEAWRIASAIPRIGVDTGDGDLPQEARSEGAVSFDKGCFLGQEAVAKMRNLGHPRRLVTPLEGAGAVSPGEPVVADDVEAGVVTSAARVDGASLALARIGWEHRDRVLRTAGGVELRPRDAGGLG